MTRWDWQPGNGSRYDLIYGNIGDKNFLAWMRGGGSGGRCIVWSSYLHCSYLREKLDINLADADGILLFLEKKGHKVGRPDVDYLFYKPESERLKEISQ
jgi:hypothetical protein